MNAAINKVIAFIEANPGAAGNAEAREAAAEIARWVNAVKGAVNA